MLEDLLLEPKNKQKNLKIQEIPKILILLYMNYIITQYMNKIKATL